MAHPTEIVSSVDHQFTVQINQLLLKDEIEEEREEIKETNGEDQLVLQTKRFRHQMMFDENFKDSDNTCMRSATIFKVNMGLRKSNPDAYTPMLISIGPYHKKNPQLSSMNKYKLLYLQRFLKRKVGLDVKSCISELEKKKDEALKCYDDNFDDGEFSEMLLLDGCFLVEFVRESYTAQEDCIINLEWMKKQVCRDMVLLENQLPFFVLTMLHNMTKLSIEEESFLCMVRTTIVDTFPKAKSITTPEINKINAERLDHLVHAVYKFCRPSDRDHNNAEQNTEASRQNVCCNITVCGNILQLTKSKEPPEDINIWDCYHIPSVTELFDAGVNFIRIGYVQRSHNIIRHQV